MLLVGLAYGIALLLQQPGQDKRSIRASAQGLGHIKEGVGKNVGHDQVVTARWRLVMLPGIEPYAVDQGIGTTGIDGFRGHVHGVGA